MDIALYLILLLIFLISLYLKVYSFYKNNSHKIFINRLISSLGLFYLFTSLIITGIYIPRDAIIFLLGGLLSFNLLESNSKNVIDR